MPDPAVSLRPGDTLPFSYGMDQAQRYWSFEEQAGRPVVLIVAGDAPPSAVWTLAEAFSAQAEAFAERGADVRLLARACTPGWATAEPLEGVALTHAMGAELFEAAGAPAALVADRALRLVARIDLRQPSRAVADALAALETLTPEPAREVRSPAPVLITPPACSTLTPAPA